MARILLTGATGFLGTHLSEALLQAGHEVTTLIRDVSKAPEGVAPVEGDIFDMKSLEHASEDNTVVVHLVGVIRERGKATFERVHVQGTKNLAKAAKKAKVRRFIYVSALGASPKSKSAYHISKYEAELIVKQSGIPYTLLRPSIIIGKGDAFATMLARVAKVAPLIFAPPLFSNARLQPVAVDDVVRCIVSSLQPKHKNRTYEIAGPKVLSLKQFFKKVLAVNNTGRLFVPVPDFAFQLAAPLMSRLLGLPLSRDTLVMLREAEPCDHTLAEKAFSMRFMSPEKALKALVRD